MSDAGTGGTAAAGSSGPDGGAGGGEEVVVRPLLPADVAAAQDSSYEALREAGTRYEWVMPELDDEDRARGRLRVAHLQRTDPAGAWVADRAGAVVGVALGMRRGPLWFLSLLTVSREVQDRGIGGRLLRAALGVADGSTAGLIISSNDPKALRRYALAGFGLLPGYDALGTVNRALLPVVDGVRDGDWGGDGELVDDLGRRLRGAAYGPDLAAYRESGARLLIAADGFAVLRGGRLIVLGATEPRTAQDLLWAALAEGPPDVEIMPFTGAQQWGIEVVLAARLTLHLGESVCTRGGVGPMTPYLPGGAYG